MSNSSKGHIKWPVKQAGARGFSTRSWRLHHVGSAPKRGICQHGDDRGRGSPFQGAVTDGSGSLQLAFRCGCLWCGWRRWCVPHSLTLPRTRVVATPPEPGSTFSLETLARGSVDIGRVSAVASVSTKEGLRIVCLCGHQVVLLTFPLNHDGTCGFTGAERGACMHDSLPWGLHAACGMWCMAYDVCPCWCPYYLGAAGAAGSLDSNHVTLPATATAVCWNPAGTCVVVGDARGSLHFVTCDGALLFSQQIFQVAAGSDGDGTPPRVFGGMAFAASAPDAAASDVDELVVASVDGQVLRFGNLRVQALRDAAVSRDPAVVRSARRSITLSKLSVTDLFADGVNDVAVTRGASGTVVAIAGDGNTAAAVFVATTATSDDGGGATPAALALEAAVARDMVGCGVAQLALSADGSNLFLVGADGTLSWWRLPGVVLVAAWAVRGVCRVAIVPAADTANGGNGAAPGAGHSGSSGAGGGGGAGASIATSLGLDAAAPSAVLVAALVSGHGDGDHEQLWLVEADLDAGAFSEGAATVSVRLPRGSWLSAPVSAGVPHDTESRDTLGPDLSTAGETGVVVCAAGSGVDEVMLWHLSRAVPLARVEALVGSGQFDAALAWAASHGIDHAEVFAAQAAVLSRRLTAASTATVDGGDDAAASSDADAEAAVDEFITSMDEVADLRRVTRWCLDTVVRQRSLTSRLMEYAERRVINRMEVLGIDEDDNEDDGSAPGVCACVWLCCVAVLCGCVVWHIVWQRAWGVWGSPAVRDCACQPILRRVDKQLPSTPVSELSKRPVAVGHPSACFRPSLAALTASHGMPSAPCRWAASCSG